MTDRPWQPDDFALASDVSRAIASSADLDEMLAAIAHRVAEALDVWECDVYEYWEEGDALIATALWARDVRQQDLDWLGTVVRIPERSSYRHLLTDRTTHEYHVDDPLLPAEEAETMREWGERSALIVPLVFQDEVIGALTLVEKRSSRRFSRGDLHMVELMAVPAAVAVHNARMLRRGAAQTRRLQALLAASRAMSSSIDLERVLADIAGVAWQALDADASAIMSHDRDADTITVVAYDLRDPRPGWEEYVGTSFALADYPGDRVKLVGGSTIVECVSDTDAELEESTCRWMAAAGDKVVLSAPMVYEDAPVGFLSFVAADAERTFTDEEKQLALALAEQAAAALHHAQLLQRAEDQNRQLGLLLESMRAISSSVVLEDVLATVARTTAVALGAEQCQIQEYDAAACTVKPVAFWQRRDDVPEPESMGKTYSLEHEPEERDFLEGRHIVQQLYSDPHVAPHTRAVMDKYGDRSYLNIPLVFNDQSYGVLVLVETDYERRWTDEDIALGEALADQAAVAIEHARLYRRVQDQAVRDGLTGLYNHRHFYERLEQEIARAGRYGTPVSLLMVDIDDFKAFNDRFGHVAGDVVLRELAAALRTELRHDVDIAARYGGEEFAVILPDTDAVVMAEPPDGATCLAAPDLQSGAAEVAERIRRRVAVTRGEGPGGDLLPALTVSVGVAVLEDSMRTPEELVAAADAALYRAKRAGKDRVECHA